jgi:hypothetical protein
MDSYRAEAYGLLSFATLPDLMRKFLHGPCNPLQSGVTTSQLCKPSTQSIPESAQYNPIITFERVGTLSKQLVGLFKLILHSLCNV